MVDTDCISLDVYVVVSSLAFGVGVRVSCKQRSRMGAGVWVMVGDARQMEPAICLSFTRSPTCRSTLLSASMAAGIHVMAMEFGLAIGRMARAIQD